MNRIIEQALLNLLVPALDSLGEKWKTVVGIALVSLTFLAHILGLPLIDQPIGWLNDATPYAWLMGIGSSVFGIGFIHKLAKLPVSGGTTDQLP